MSAGEYSFLTDTPNALKTDVPPQLCFVAEDVLEGVRLAVRTLNNSAAPEKLDSRQRLEIATRKLLKWLDDLPRIQCRPFIEAIQPLEAYRLGRLLNDEYALYEGPVQLVPARHYPINYIFGHSPPYDKEKSDTVAGMEYQKQLYLGYAPPAINDMDGYAISLGQLLVLEERQALRLDAEPASGLQLPYYRGFPDLGPA